MRRTIRPLVTLLAAMFLVAPAAVADDPPGAPAIGWNRRIVEAFEKAKQADKPLFVAILSERVDGGRVEPAGKELREVTYRDSRVIDMSKSFVCAYLTSEGSSEDFGELRARYAIEGLIVSPQHLFAYPDGTLISRHEYWPYGVGEDAVKALINLMDKALKKDRGRRGLPAEPEPKPPRSPRRRLRALRCRPLPGAGAPADPAAQPDAEARARWIADLVAVVRTGDPDARRQAIEKLAAEKDGAGFEALRAILPDLKRDPDTQAELARALGRPGLEAAVPILLDLLDAKDLTVRANAAVSLEYVGSKTAVDGLLKEAPREKDEKIANHMYRALGRCGAGNDKVRDVLSSKTSGAKSEAASYGPIIGLAYFEKDPKAAREVEKLIVREGITGTGRRGGGQGTLKRTILLWCLTEIADPKSEKFVREKMIESVGENDPWGGMRLRFYEAAAKVIAGDAAAKAEVEGGVNRVLAWVAEEPLVDDARRGREETGFKPKGEWTGGGMGGGGGGGGGPGGDGKPPGG